MIRMDEVTRRIGPVTALDRATLQVPEGSVFALLGPNGAGKSTALKICANLLQPQRGRVEIAGVDSRRLGPAQLARLAYLAEERRLPEWMTAAEWFRYQQPFYPGWREDELTELTRLHHLPLDRPLRTLSRGQRMQTALCAALAYCPALLLLDEPFSGLDLLVRERFLETLAARSGPTTILLATHDLAEIENFATHVAYLAEGRIHFVEEMESLAARFRELEVELAEPAPLPAALPVGWLAVQQAGRTLRLVTAHYQAGPTESEIRDRFQSVRAIAAHPLPLRSIFVELARAERS